MNKALKRCFVYIDKDNSDKTKFFRFVLKFKAFISQIIFRHIELPYLEIIITTKCNLNCKYCSQLIPYIQSPEHFSFEKFKMDIDVLFSKVKKIYRLRLHGGEPFTNPELYKMLNYIKDRKEIGSIRITTNGSIVPNKKLLDAMKDGKIVLKISDYSITKNKSNLINVLESNNINYVLMSNQKWKKFTGFTERSKSNFNECFLNRCTCLFNGKLYVCARAAIADYLNIKNDQDALSIYENNGKNLYKFYNSADMNICHYCDGDTADSEEIEPAEQNI